MFSLFFAVLFSHPDCLFQLPCFGGIGCRDVCLVSNMTSVEILELKTTNTVKNLQQKS